MIEYERNLYLLNKVLNKMFAYNAAKQYGYTPRGLSVMICDKIETK